MFILFYSRALYRKAPWPSQEAQGLEPGHLDSRSLCGRLELSWDLSFSIVTSGIVEQCTVYIHPFG